eukprot:TRINITY_DN2950_c0_g1_i1.p1 TRINITY_DN2950_c0_g1~~TRINITY_DN2950_c0_g1_i1.p1  ORF type:complete len:237 (-),score=-1.29 TRINITY_DN2950_c0_g1_i1:341-1051(-)
MSNIFVGDSRIYTFPCCSIVTGPDRGAFWIAVLLVIAPSSLHCAFVSWQLVYLSPFFLFFSILLPIITEFLHFFTAFSDPGIIPRCSVPVPDKEKKDIEVIGSNGEPYMSSFCQTCNIRKPRRAHHCRICNNCILNFDHHCPWVGNCVGRRNYKFFVMFLFSVMITGLYMIATSSYLIANVMITQNEAFLNATFIRNPIASCLVIYTVIILVTLSYLFCYHIHLLGTGATTYESVS